MRLLFSRRVSRQFLNSRNSRVVCSSIAAALVLSLFISAPATGGLFIPPWDKVVHFLFYGTIALLLAVAGGPSRLTFAMLITCLIGGMDETYQLILPGRQADLGDLAVDIVAAATFTLIVRWFYSRYFCQ